MNNLIKALFFALIFACGAPGEDIAPSENIGTIEQPIFMPSAYGFEDGNNAPRCIPPWDGGHCWVPDNTGDNVKLLYWIDDASCTHFNGFFKDRIHETFLIVQSKLRAQGLVVELMGTKLEAKYTIKCGTNASGSLGRFAPVSQQIISTVNGDLVQFGSGTVTIDQSQIEATPCFQTSTLQKQVDFSDNVIQHEMWHVAGIGHENKPGGNGITVMDPFYDGATNKASCTGFMNLKTTDLAAIDCYNATSGTGDRCAD